MRIKLLEEEENNGFTLKRPLFPTNRWLRQWSSKESKHSSLGPRTQLILLLISIPRWSSKELGTVRNCDHEHSWVFFWSHYRGGHREKAQFVIATTYTVDLFSSNLNTEVTIERIKAQFVITTTNTVEITSYVKFWTTVRILKSRPFGVHKTEE